MKEIQSKGNLESGQDGMQKLEDALLICKFGRFHIKLLFTTVCAVIASMMVTTTSSYILPSAECDLGMNIMEKGILNAMPFFGQVGAGLFTGFITDAFGRKIFLVGGNVGIFVCSVLEGSSQSYWMLALGKACEGVSLSLCCSATSAMVTEFTHKNIRDKVLLLSCSFVPLSLIISALTSWALLPRTWHFVIVDGYFVLNSWNIYLYVCSIWSLLAAVLYYSLPESPKFLLSHGQGDEALEILKDIYSINTGNNRDTFPISSLNASETFVKSGKSSMKNQLTQALFEVKFLFRKPLLLKLILFSLCTFLCLLAYSSLRLWFPQLSTVIETYQKEHGETSQFCTMIDDYRQKIFGNTTTDLNDMKTEICIPNLSGNETYINGIILGLASFCSIVISVYLVDYFGQKLLMFGFLILCGACSGSLYWTNSSILIAVLVSATCGFMQTTLSLQQNILVRVFPTTLRSLTLSIILIFGRIGSLLGTTLFPVLLELGCMIPFLTLTIITLCVAGLVYFLPNPSNENNGNGDK